MYSQREEQQVITDYFKGFTGHLLSLGENDGKTFSNALALIEQGWSADLVEPSTEVFNRLVALHKENEYVALHKVAVGESNGMQDFYESGSLLNCNDHSLVSTLKESETIRWKTTTAPDQKIVEYRTTQVQVVDFKTLLCLCMYKQFDFITMDIEGMELEVLRQMDIERLGVKLICIEYNGKNQELFDELIPLPVIYKNRTNLIYGR